MKNSKGETLPQPYLDLARMRREKKPYDDAILGFVWNNTPEGYVFWSCVNRGESPALFKSQLAELEEWRKAKHPYNEIAAYQEDPPEQPAERDWKAMYEALRLEANELTSALKELGAKYDELKSGDPTRNWIAECAMAAMQGYISNPSESDVVGKWVLQMLGLPENTKYDWLVHHPQFVAKLSFNYAEALVAEGKKRGHIN